MSEKNDQIVLLRHFLRGRISSSNSGVSNIRLACQNRPVRGSNRDIEFYKIIIIII